MSSFLCSFYKNNFLTLIIWILLCFGTVTWSASLEAKGPVEGQGLYSADDDVDVLTVHNFNQEVMGSKQAWVVEFYNSWCGFCQRFAPSWKSLAADLKPWKDLMKIAAIDCSNDENYPVCRNYEIMAYPTLRYFHENYQQADGKIGDEIRKGPDMVSHRENIVAKLIEEQREGRGLIYPNLQPFPYDSLYKMFDSLPPTVKYGFMVLEKGDHLLGATVAMDFHKIPNITIRYALINNTALINKLQITHFPTLIAIDRNNKTEIYSDDDLTRESLKAKIISYLEPRNIQINDLPQKKDLFLGRWIDAEVPDMTTLMEERARKVIYERVKKMGDVVFQMDLETTLRYSLEHEISTNKIITGEKLHNLTAYFKLLEKYFPFGQGGQVFLHELVEAVEGKDKVEGTEIMKIVQRGKQEDAQVFSSPHQWLGCRGSTPSRRGYPCGLWKLFHYLTVNAAEHNKNNKDTNPHEVLDVMYGYVKSFFGCADCSRHFQEMAHRRNLTSVSSSDDSILWLWEAHNEVNKRLAGDVTEDPEFPKTQFPLKERCPECRLNDGTWNLQEVLRYLKRVYSSINVRYIGSDTRILHIGFEGDNGRSSRGMSIFRTLDMSMCFILYVCSFLLLTLLIRLFLKRGYRKKPYVHDMLGKV